MALKYYNMCPYKLPLSSFLTDPSNPSSKILKVLHQLPCSTAREKESFATPRSKCLFQKTYNSLYRAYGGPFSPSSSITTRNAPGILYTACPSARITSADPSAYPSSYTRITSADPSAHSSPYTRITSASLSASTASSCPACGLPAGRSMEADTGLLYCFGWG